MNQLITAIIIGENLVKINGVKMMLRRFIRTVDIKINYLFNLQLRKASRNFKQIYTVLK